MQIHLVFKLGAKHLELFQKYQFPSVIFVIFPPVEIFLRSF
jgi:hypothetical protein